MKEQLADLLGHYLKTAFDAAGVPWTSDQWSEVQEIADLIESIAYSAAGDVVASSVNEEARI